MDRRDVYEIIDGERDYQDGRWGATLSGGRTPGTGQSGGDRTVDEFALYIMGYAMDLAADASHTLDPNSKLAAVRKVAGLCVACMEQHGAPRR